MKSLPPIRLVSLMVAATLSLNTTGCSVYFASSGSKDPDFSKLIPGTSRPVVEQELGLPVETKKKGAGESALYTYKVGDTAAPGRAMLYLLGDIVTFCLAEYIFFPLEISNSGNSFQAVVDYGSRDQMITFRRIDDTSKTSPLDQK